VHAADSDTAKEKVNALEADIHILRAQLVASNAELDDSKATFESELHNAHRHHDELREQLRMLSEELQQLQGDHSDHTNTTEAQLRAQEALYRDLQAEYESLQSRTQRMQDNQALLKKRLDDEKIRSDMIIRDLRAQLQESKQKRSVESTPSRSDLDFSLLEQTPTNSARATPRTLHSGSSTGSGNNLRSPSSRALKNDSHSHSLDRRQQNKVRSQKTPTAEPSLIEDTVPCVSPKLIFPVNVMSEMIFGSTAKQPPVATTEPFLAATVDDEADEKIVEARQIHPTDV
jgi:DNA repair exonuclease SbcCD ATPase subunit